MTNILIVGAGQLGSRHLQSLKKVKKYLNISVVDNNPESLQIAHERYLNFGETICEHSISFYQNITDITLDQEIAIIATNSNSRRIVIETLLKKINIKNFILEKILFSNIEDYSFIQNLFEKRSCNAWVNCTMRKVPFYNELKEQFNNSQIHYRVIGSQYGLVTNMIHYLDHMVYLTNCSSFELDTTNLLSKTIPSKRLGFLELNGTCIAKFKNGSIGYFTCFEHGNLPVTIEIISDSHFYLSNESEKKAAVISAKNHFISDEINIQIPYQSEMTYSLVEDILNSNFCPLVSFSESIKIHLNLLNPLSSFLIKNGIKTQSDFPFT